MTNDKRIKPAANIFISLYIYMCAFIIESRDMLVLVPIPDEIIIIIQTLYPIRPANGETL